MDGWMDIFLGEYTCVRKPMLCRPTHKYFCIFILNYAHYHHIQAPVTTTFMHTMVYVLQRPHGTLASFPFFDILCLLVACWGGQSTLLWLFCSHLHLVHVHHSVLNIVCITVCIFMIIHQILFCTQICSILAPVFAQRLCGNLFNILSDTI